MHGTPVGGQEISTMAEYIAIDPRAEVRGHSLLSSMNAMGPYSGIGFRNLSRHGINTFAPDDWYPQQWQLDALKTLADTVGESILFAAGKKIPEFAAWPEHIKTIEEALASIDIAYHMNHRIEGEVLFDPATGTIKEGIGHYRHIPVSERRAVLHCTDPFPSEFDRGIIFAIARKFEPTAEVELDPTKPNRKNGADSCSYNVTW
jgi:hypothetical protein